MESQISKLAVAAERLSKRLPQFEPKPHNTKKKVCKELEVILRKRREIKQNVILMNLLVSNVNARNRPKADG